MIVIKICLIIMFIIVAITCIIGLLGLSYSIIDAVCEEIFNAGLIEIIKTHRKKRNDKTQYLTF